MPHLAALAAWFAAAACTTTACRSGLTTLAGRFPAWRPTPPLAAIVGDPGRAGSVLDDIPGHGAPFRIAGFFDDQAAAPPGVQGHLPFLGDIDDLVEIIGERQIQDVLLAVPWAEQARIAAAVERLRFLPVTLRLLPERATGEGLPAKRDGIVMPTLMEPPFTAADRQIKRLFDIAFGLLLLVLLMPLLAAIAIVIKADSEGPVLFKQARTGQFGRTFQILKFRSLHVNAADPAAETLVTWGDRRVTRFGMFLRARSLDELPQILNVIAGDMSLVGPRPHAARAKADGQVYTDVFPEYRLRYRVKPGMTGWAQVNGWRGNTDTVDKLQRRIECDFHYIKTWSMAFDLYILFRTIPFIVAPPAEKA